MLTSREIQLALHHVVKFDWDKGEYWNTAIYPLPPHLGRWSDNGDTVVTKSRLPAMAIQKLQRFQGTIPDRALPPHTAIAIQRGDWTVSAWNTALEDVLITLWGDVYIQGTDLERMSLLYAYQELLGSNSYARSALTTLLSRTLGTIGSELVVDPHEDE